LDKKYRLMRKIFILISVIVFCFSCKDETKKAKETILTKPKIVLPEALQELVNDAKKDSNNVSKQVELIRQLDSSGFHSNALHHLDILISKDSLNNDYWLKRGQICKVLEDTPSAIKAFHYAARIYPTPLALMELANLYAETKNVKTVSICKQLMSMNPDGSYDAQANFFMGVFFSKMNDIPNAIKYFDLSIEKDFHFDDAYIEKGYLLYNNKKYDAALTVFKQLVAVNQTSADGYYWIAKNFEALGKIDEAIKNYNKALVFNTELNEAKQAITRLSSKKN
jgi:tetratricopeptide (TPR) repeat protein